MTARFSTMQNPLIEEHLHGCAHNDKVQPGTLPRILSRADNGPQRQFVLDIAAELGWFNGHFPGNPVLPGIVQLHWAAILAAACFGFPDVPVAIKRLKFKSVVVPPNVLELSLSKINKCEVQFAYANSGQQYSEGRLIFEEAG